MIDSLLNKAHALGASLAGMVGLADDVAARIELPASIPRALQRGSVLVLALAHDVDHPELDWWDGPGGTEGNRRLQALTSGLKRFLADEHGVRSRDLAYHPWKGGILLKNAATLAGMGVIGANNLLITPQLGTRVRLRAMVLAAECAPPVAVPSFDPCQSCHKPCWQACPQEAFASGTYDRSRCAAQMAEDEARAPAPVPDGMGIGYVQYCRACELACPVAYGRSI